jgi:hypothetical protein
MRERVGVAAGIAALVAVFGLSGCVEEDKRTLVVENMRFGPGGYYVWVGDTDFGVVDWMEVSEPLEVGHGLQELWLGRDRDRLVQQLDFGPEDELGAWYLRLGFGPMDELTVTLMPIED